MTTIRKSLAIAAAALVTSASVMAGPAVEVSYMYENGTLNSGTDSNQYGQAVKLVTPVTSVKGLEFDIGMSNSHVRNEYTPNYVTRSYASIDFGVAYDKFVDSDVSIGVGATRSVVLTKSEWTQSTTFRPASTVSVNVKYQGDSFAIGPFLSKNSNDWADITGGLDGKAYVTKSVYVLGSTWKSNGSQNISNSKSVGHAYGLSLGVGVIF